MYTDGALRGLVPCIRRAGWAFVGVNDQDVTWGRFGTVSEQYTTIFRAELRAAIEALCHCVPLVTIHTDSQQVVDGWNAGQRWSCASNRDGADLWRIFWARNRDIGQASTL